VKYDHGGSPNASIDASVNVNPFGPPACLDIVFSRARELAMRYPEIDAASARREWATRLGIPTEHLLVGNGASELISLAMRALRPKRVVIFEPCYSEYASAAETIGADVVRLDFRLEGSAWSTPAVDYESREGDLLVLGQPNNPTGHLTSPDMIADLARAGVRILLDESFLPFLVDADDLSMSAGELPGVLVVTSLTKMFCVPGLRLGILVGDAETVERMSRLRDPWSVNALAAEAAEALARESEYLIRTRAWLAGARAELANTLAEIPSIRVCEGVAPYILVELPEPVCAAELRDVLAARGIGVRDASTFIGLGPHWLRVGVRSPAENALVAAAIVEQCEAHAR
jgi:threonine-phosphate decarboxylase